MKGSQEAENQKASRSTIWYVIRNMISWAWQASRRVFPALLILLVVVSILPFVNNYIDSLVIDELVKLIGNTDQGTSQLVQLILIVIVVTVLERTTWGVINYLDKAQYFNISRYAALKFLRKAVSLDMYHYESPESNNLIRKASDSYNWKPREFISRMVWMVGDLVRIITSMVVVISFSVPAFLLVVATTVPSMIVNVKLGKGSWGIWDASSEDRRMFWRTADMMHRESTLLEIRIFQTHKYLMKVVTNIYDRFTNKEKKDQLKRSIAESVFGNLSVVGILIFWIIAISAALNGDITLGLLTFYTSSVNRFSDALTNFVRQMSRQYEEVLYLSDLLEFMNLKNTIVTGHKKLAESEKPPLIEFRDVSFQYPDTDKYVLNNLNLTIEPGSRIALVGENGAGKTTLIKLLCRFYDVTSGQILVDGVDIRDLSLVDWYSKVGVLFQQFVKYSQFSVKENVGLGDVNQEMDVQKIIDAIEKADASKFVGEYENEIDQILDKSFPGGIDPSGGQWQRIALARAFFRNAPILVLDEPTSAIDAKAEFQIFEQLYKFSADKTVIIISHRFSTVRKADQIYVVDDGQIAEQGSHEQLLASNKKYAEAFRLQAEGYK